MMRQFLYTVIAVLLATSSGTTKELKGIDMPDTLVAGKDTLTLNGAGVRVKFLMDIYVAGLYLKETCHDPKKIIEADEPMAVRLHIVSTLITGEKMSKSTEEGFVASTGGNTAPLQGTIDRFIDIFNDEIQKNDVYDLIYLPGTGVESYKNKKLIITIPGLDFKQALFGIWLCEKPIINLDLKKGMLGN